MKHETFIKLYEERTAKGTWKAWRERHKNDPIWPELGFMSHKMTSKLKRQYGDIGKTSQTLRDFLIERFDSGRQTIKARPEIAPSQLAKLMNASGLDWFTKNDKAWVHWTHRLKEQNEQIQKTF